MIRARYTGKERDEEAYAGIPLRDLNEEDWDALQPEQQKLVEAGEVYRVLKRPAAPGEAEPEAEQPQGGAT